MPSRGMQKRPARAVWLLLACFVVLVSAVVMRAMTARTDAGQQNERAQAEGHEARGAAQVPVVRVSASEGRGERSPRADPAGAPSASAEGTRPGIAVLLGGDLSLLRDARVGLITNHTGRLAVEGTSAGAASETTIDLLYRHPAVNLVALFSPEHGIRGTAEAGEAVASSRDPQTGLPIHSLYGDTREPTPEMLADVDVLVFDIQDIGTRYYTYVWTMAHAMRAAAENSVRFVVLDRPNPIGGTQMQGNVLEPEYSSFVGLYPVPMRHGLTPGELARLVNEEFELGVQLDIVPLEGWTRAMWYDETGLVWTPPSPNMPSLESAAHYPGTCLFEGTNVSVGRGTDRAFQQIGAPWLDHDAIVSRLDGYGLPGVRFEAVDFTPANPGDGKFGGQRVRGVRLHVTDRAAYDPAMAAIAMLVEIQRLHPGQLDWRVSHFDRLAGTARIREGVIASATLQEITAGWDAELAEFRAIAASYLLYRE